MIKAYWKPKGKIEEGKIENLRSKKPVWVDCFKPSKQELDELSALTGIDASDFKEHILDYERPTTEENEKYSLLIFGAPVLKKGGGEAASLAIFILNNGHILTFRTEEIEGLQKFRQDLFEKNLKYFDHPSRIVQAILERVIDSYFEHFDLFQEAADRIEAIVFKNPQKKAIEEVFKIRKSILFFHKALVANREVILAIEKQHLSRLAKRDLPAFRDVYNDIVQLVDTSDTQRSVLTGILDIYTSSSANQVNEVMKKLTVVASYVLIPTLIASIYGMNFKYMPEIPWKWGYPFSLILMAVSILAVYYYFKRQKML